tara:strand:- start:16326 stop:17318 length:993 start_codon:yes stop_codon:yes gene_type:complete
MASNIAFSPKEWEVWMLGESTLGTAVTASSGMYQLDVDSISMPSLNVNQSLDLRSSAGRTFKAKDFYQDNNLRIVEIGLAGRFHDDAGHLALLENITSNAGPDFTVASGYSPEALKYGESETAADFDTFTLVLKAPSQSNGKNIELPGCVVTNFSLSSDMNTDGGQYKWSATMQTGCPCDFAETTNAGGTAYVNTDFFKLSSATATEVLDADVALNSFTFTIDNPAVFIGTKLDTGGYEVINRGSEMAVTLDCQVKYDDATDEFINTFDAQTGAFTTTYPFKLTASNAGGVEISNAVLTNVALVEGDIMMLDVSMKSVDDGTDALFTLDF